MTTAAVHAPPRQRQQERPHTCCDLLFRDHEAFRAHCVRFHLIPTGILNRCARDCLFATPAQIAARGGDFDGPFAEPHGQGGPLTH